MQRGRGGFSSTAFVRREKTRKYEEIIRPPCDGIIQRFFLKPQENVKKQHALKDGANTGVHSKVIRFEW